MGARGGRRGGGRGGSCLRLTLLYFRIDFVSALLAGCATALLENHFSDLKIKVLRGHLKCPHAPPPQPAACGGGGTESHPGQASLVLPPPPQEWVPLFGIPALYTSIPLLGKRRELLAWALRGTRAALASCHDAMAGARAPANVIPEGTGKGNRLLGSVREGERFAEPQSRVTRA